MAEPTDEDAHLHLARGRAAAGDPKAGLRLLDRLETILREELGEDPSDRAREPGAGSRLS